MNSQKVFTAFQLVAGGCDAVTGALLLVSPVFTLRLMGVHQTIAEPVLISFIGVFVFSIGLSYLLFSTPPRNSNQVAAVRAAWLITGIIRLCVATFVAGACFAGRLEPAWLTITIVDFSLAVIQLTARQKFLVAGT
jgi:hypothetical protein